MIFNLELFCFWTIHSGFVIRILLINLFNVLLLFIMERIILFSFLNFFLFNKVYNNDNKYQSNSKEKTNNECFCIWVIIWFSNVSIHFYFVLAISNTIIITFTSDIWNHVFIMFFFTNINPLVLKARHWWLCSLNLKLY